MRCSVKDLVLTDHRSTIFMQVTSLNENGQTMKTNDLWFSAYKNSNGWT